MSRIQLLGPALSEQLKSGEKNMFAIMKFQIRHEDSSDKPQF